MIYKIETKNAYCVIDPQGATILACQMQGINVLQSCESLSRWTKDQTGGFPLLPIANRVANDQYILGSETVYLAKNTLNHTEYLHGIGWTNLWQVTKLHNALEQSSLALTLQSRGEVEQKYNFTASLVFTLTDLKLEINLKLNPLNDYEPRLYGLGFHPYFCYDLGDELQINATGYCQAQEGSYLLASPSSVFVPEFDFRSFKTIPDIFANHCYVGCQDVIIKRNRYGAKFALRSSCDNLMFYHAPSSNFVALEPQTHLVNGANLPDYGGLKMLSSPHEEISLNLAIICL